LPWPALLAAGVGALSLVALVLAWQGQAKLRELERELVRRQDGSQTEAAEARRQAKDAQELSRDSAAKIALLEARLAEVALQRGQLEELIQSMSRSRDENVIGDIEASIRVAMQQSSITGSAEPLVATLRQADERLLRYKQPRMDGVRRAVARDLDRVKAIQVADVSTLTIKIDEVVRLLDELPLLVAADKSDEATLAKQRRADKAAAPSSAAAARSSSGSSGASDWWSRASRQWEEVLAGIWIEAKSLLRVTRIDHPEAMLLAPDQSFFLRENMKLRLLNARLALLSRQFDTAQTDLRETLGMLDRHFDSRSRKVTLASELLRQVAGQARQVNVPRPDDTLAALAAVGAGR
jgi:uroporphyrin-3 C-methyltransferase